MDNSKGIAERLNENRKARKQESLRVDEAIKGFNGWNGTGSLDVGKIPEVDALVAKAVGLPLPALKGNFTRYTIPAIGGNFIEFEGKASGTLKISDKSALKEIYKMAKSK